MLEFVLFDFESLERTLSTAEFVKLAHKTDSPRETQVFMISTIVIVFPVPGRPTIKLNLLALRLRDKARKNAIENNKRIRDLKCFSDE